MRVIVIILLFLGLVCDDQEQIPKPDDLIEEGTYIQLLAELQLLDAIAYVSSDSLNLDSLINQVYIHYDVEEDQFLSSHRYYQSKPNEHVVRLDSALNILKREQQALEDDQ